MIRPFIEILLDIPDMYCVRIGNWIYTVDDLGEKEWEYAPEWSRYETNGSGEAGSTAN
jgi:hypothetical protein